MVNLSFEIPFNNAAEGMIVADNKGFIVHVNTSAERMFGYSREELSGQPIEQLLPQRVRERHVQHRENFNQNPHTRPMGKGLELFARRKNEEEFPVEISLSPFNFNEVTYVLAFIVDITEKKEAAQKLEKYYSNLEKEVEKRTMVLKEAVSELEKTKIELNEALSKEKKLNDLKSRFVSMVSHEFRTPLATVHSSVDLAEKYLDQQDPESQRKHFRRIRASLKGLTAILNDVLSLGRLEEGKINVSPESIDFHTFFSELVEEMQSIAKEGQTLQFSTKGDPVAMQADKNILRQIATNLISNAIKFSEEHMSIQILAGVDSGILELTVTDKGIGIPEEDQKNLFKSFFRGQNASTIQGTGLGLNIVTKYLQLLGGDIDFTSTEGAGSRFTVRIPVGPLGEVS
jgi:PAS domain S-box-containing protein